MAQSAASALGRARELAAWLRAGPQEGNPLPEVVSELGRIFQVPDVFSYGLTGETGEARVEFFHGTSADGPRRRRLLQKMVGAPPYLFYDPLVPSREQRNRVFSCRALPGGRLPPHFAAILERHGLPARGGLRVLLCDGPSLLAWLGALGDRDFAAADERALAVVARPLRERLLLQRRLGMPELLWAALDAALEATGAPALVVGAPCRIVHCSPSAEALLARDRRSFLEGLPEALRGREDRRWQLVRLRVGGSPHWLALRTPEQDDAAPRLARVRGLLRLTPRQAEVLGHLARGEANKTIAARLGCGESAVEQHVTALLGRFGASGRAELVARFWAARD